MTDATRTIDPPIPTLPPEKVRAAALTACRERHTMLPATEHEEPVPACLDCETWCDASMPCRCCLTLRAEKAEAAIARVRAAAMVNFPDGEVAHPPDGMYHDPSVFYGLRAAAYEVLAALDEPEVTA